MADPIRITTADLQGPEVNDYVEMQKYLQRDVSDAGRQPWLIRVIYANWFYLSLSSMLGGLVAWACLEPWFEDQYTEEVDIVGFFLFPTVAAGIGLYLGAAEGIMCRNFQRAVLCGAVGLGIGFVGGLVAIIPSSIVFVLMTTIAVSISGELDENGLPMGLGLLVFMMGRSAAWTVASIPAGLGQGIALREKKVIINGVVGSLLGGLIGGLLFDPISLVLTAADGQATYSRAVRIRDNWPLRGTFRRPDRRLDENSMVADAQGPAGRQTVHHVQRHDDPWQFAEG